MGRYTYLPIRYHHDTWVPIRYVLRFFLRISILQVLRFRYCYVSQFLFLVFNSSMGKSWMIHLIYRLSQLKKFSNYYCNSILQFIVIFVCLLKTRQWKIVDYTLKRDCIWWVILTKTMNHIFLNFYFRIIHIHSVYLKYLEPWNFKVPKPWTCTWI